jgi:hypothetical protein
MHECCSSKKSNNPNYLVLVQCSGQMLRRPEHGRLNCPELTTWIAKPGQRCRLECDGGYTPSVSQVNIKKLIFPNLFSPH